MGTTEIPYLGLSAANNFGFVSQNRIERAIRLYAFIPTDRQIKRVPGAVKCGLQVPSSPPQSDEWTMSAGGYFCQTKPILGAAA
jgi:hypothetical protein